MHCLLIAPYGADLDALRSVLEAERVEAVSTSELGAGIALARAHLSDFDCAIAVLPAADSAQPWLPALYVEIGIAAGRGMPVLALTEPPGSPSPSLAGLSAVSVSVKNLDALRLHVPLFIRSVQAGDQSGYSRQATHTEVDLDIYRSRLRRLRTVKPDGRQALDFQSLVVDILRDGGAQAEERGYGRSDDGVDIAAFLPGDEKLLGTLLIQVKWGRPPSQKIREIQQRLSEQVLRTRGGLGVFVYDRLTVPIERMPSVPLVFALGIDDLLAELADHSLSEIFVRARNRAVHGM